MIRVIYLINNFDSIKKIKQILNQFRNIKKKNNHIHFTLCFCKNKNIKINILSNIYKKIIFRKHITNNIHYKNISKKDINKELKKYDILILPKTNDKHNNTLYLKQSIEGNDINLSQMLKNNDEIIKIENYNKLKINILKKIINFKNNYDIKNNYNTKIINSFIQILLSIRNNLKGCKIIPYIIRYLPYDIYSGYTLRSHKILNTFNNLYTDKQYVGISYGNYSFKKDNKTVTGYGSYRKLDNVYYFSFPKSIDGKHNTKNTMEFLDLIINVFQSEGLHTCSPHQNALPAIEYCKNHNLKSIYEIRGFWCMTQLEKQKYYNQKFCLEKYNNEINLEKWCIENCSTPLFISEELQKFACTKGIFYPQFNLNGLGCNIKKYDIFWNCQDVNLNQVQNLPIRKNSPNVFKICYSGNIVYYEGIIELIQTLEKINNKTNIDIELHLVGDVEKFINTFDDNNIRKLFSSKIVKKYGLVDQKKSFEIIKSCDLSVIPRLDIALTNLVTPLKPFEAMKMKIPLLMSDCACLKNISNNGQNCMLFKKGNYQDLETKILDIINYGYPTNILKHGYKFVTNERNWENMITKIKLNELI